MSRKKTDSKAQVIHDHNGVPFGASGIPFGTANGFAAIWTIYAAHGADEPMGELGVSDGIAFMRLENGVLIASDGINAVRFFALYSNQYVIKEVSSYSEAKLLSASARQKH